MISSVFVWVYNVNRGTPGERVGLTKGDKILLELHFFFLKRLTFPESLKKQYIFIIAHTHTYPTTKKKSFLPLYKVKVHGVIGTAFVQTLR